MTAKYLQTDSELVALCLNRDRRAQKALYERYSPRMFSVCLRYAKCTDNAKDLLQEGFITLFTHLNDYKGEGSFEGWCRRIFVTTALQKLRKNDVMEEAADVVEVQRYLTYDPGTLDYLQGKDLMRMISRMPESVRYVFNLSVIEGYSHQEIAKMLGIKISTSRTKLTRAKMWLKEQIEKMKEDEERRLI